MDYIQKKSAEPGSEPTTIVLDSNPTAGNTLVAGVWRDSETDPNVPTGFTKVLGPFGTSAPRNCWVYAKASASGSESSLEFQGRTAIVYEIPTATLDVSDTDEQSGVTELALTTATTTDDDIFAFTAVAKDQDSWNDPPVNNGFTVDLTASARRNCASKNVTTQAAVSVTWSFGDIGSSDIGGILVAYKPARSAGLSGTITSATESDIVAGGETIILTLTGDTWIPE